MNDHIFMAAFKSSNHLSQIWPPDSTVRDWVILIRNLTAYAKAWNDLKKSFSGMGKFEKKIKLPTLNFLHVSHDN